MFSIEQKDLELIVYCPEQITDVRLRNIVEASGDQSPFDHLPDLIEVFDESIKLSRRAKYCLPEFTPVPVDHQSEYLLTYYDGQLIELSDAVSQEILFRNITASCYSQINYKHDWTPFSQQK